MLDFRKSKLPLIAFAVPGPQKRPKGADLLEARIDQFKNLKPEAVARALKKMPKPILATVRSVKEGGKARLSDAQRIALFRAALPHVQALDIELSSPKVIAALKGRIGRRTLILSHHNFKSTPSNAALTRMLKAAKRLGARAFKVAANPRSSKDVLRLFAFTLKHRKAGLITISMGKLGSISRLVNPQAGSLITYTSGKPVLGQLPLARLSAAFRK